MHDQESVRGWGQVWQGACVTGWGPCMMGVCMVGGMHGRGHSW